MHDSQADVRHADASGLREKLASLQTLPFKSSIDVLYSEKLSLLVKLFDFSVKAYKEAQQIIGKIDDRIQMEYAYMSRAENAVVRLAIEGKFNFELCFAIDDALSAVRHLLNDTIDLVVEYASKEADRLDTSSKYSSISDVHPEYDEIADLIIEIDEKIAETRGIRGVLRIQTYIDIVDTGKYSRIVAFCRKLPTIERLLKKQRRIDRYEAAKVVVPILALVVAVAAAIISYLIYKK